MDRTSVSVLVGKPLRTSAWGPGRLHRVWGSGFRVWGLRFRVWGSGFRVWGLRFRVWGSGFRVWGLRFRVWSFRFRVWGSGFRVWGLRFRVWVWGLGFRVCRLTMLRFRVQGLGSALLGLWSPLRRKLLHVIA